MATSLATRLPDESKDVYFTEEFMSLIEYHLPSLRIAENTYELVVEPDKAHVYDRDLYGYLAFKGIPSYLHWIVMRINKMHNPTEFTGEIVSLFAPAPSDIESMCRVMKTVG